MQNKNIKKVDYEQKILNRLANSDEWPRFDNPDFLEELNIFADNSFKKGSLEGYLAALLVYQQLCEEMVRVLIDCSNFFIQCLVLPSKIKVIKLDRKTFGQLLFELGKGVTDESVDLFVKHCDQLNLLRNKIVHKITLKTSLRDVAKQSKEAKKIFDKIFKLFDYIYDYYRVCFKDIKKDKNF